MGAGRLRASFVQLLSRAENRKSAFLRSGAVGSQAVGMPWRCRPHCQSVMPPDTVAKNASQIPVAFWRFAVVCCLFVRFFGLCLVKKGGPVEGFLPPEWSILRSQFGDRRLLPPRLILNRGPRYYVQKTIASPDRRLRSGRAAQMRGARQCFCCVCNYQGSAGEEICGQQKVTAESTLSAARNSPYCPFGDYPVDNPFATITGTR